MKHAALAHHFRGGIVLEGHKARSTEEPIDRGFLPRELVLALRQHRGAAAVPLVQVGERVRKGQTVAAAAPGPLSAAVHASTSGIVRAFDDRPVLIGGAVSASQCIVIETDGQDSAVEQPRSSWPADTPGRLAAVRAAGIVGLGGAAYPTADKLAPSVPCQTLVVNGAECEPYISCDDLLMREHAAEIVQGALVMREILGAPECVIAIEHDKPQALAAVGAAVRAAGSEQLTVVEVPTIYPAGGERQLIEMLSGREIPSGRYPGDVGYVCHNVATAFALQRLAAAGEPLVSRVVTVTGGGVRRPRNVWVPLGAPIAELVAYCGGYTDGVVRLVAGGSMMGHALPDDSAPITKATNCIVAATSDEVRADAFEWPCIRCGECASACPAALQPQELLVAVESADTAALASLGLDDCIECGCCDVVCPSHIALTSRFRRAKGTPVDPEPDQER
jgi:electron transport complex protein RnfC